MACGILLRSLTVLLALASDMVFASFTEDAFDGCESIVLNWADSSINDGIEANTNLQDLLFFLHVPRTGGRTYFHCFLRKLYSSVQECPRSYDKLRFDPSKPGCRLMATHDDYSVMSKLPKDKTSVVTILRNPLDRVFSTYEFSVEVAARFLVHPNLTSATRMTKKLRFKSRGVSTLDIWPWKYLVPWMREDLFARRDARGNRSAIRDVKDPYNMNEIVIPLHDFINDPLAHEIIHNGVTLQVAGLTNNSCFSESNKVRNCLKVHPSLGRYVLDVAKRRLESMLYVGLTEKHKESAKMFADVVGVQILSQLQVLASQPEQVANNVTDIEAIMLVEPCMTAFRSFVAEPSSSLTDAMSEDPNNQQNVIDDSPGTVPSENAKIPKQNMTVGKLMEAYEVCISSLRKSQSVRRATSLKTISPVNFSKEARLSVPDGVIQQILSLNSLDVELYKHAKNIFMQQQEHSIHKFKEQEGGETNNTYNWWPKTLILVVMVLFFISALVIVNARRKILKLKL